MRAKRTLRTLQHPRSLMGYLRQFLTPQVCKQARQAVPRRRGLPRWDLQPLLILALAMTWAAGDSQAEKFETARGFYVATHRARKRPGATVAGFQKALARVPMRQLWAVATGVRHQIRVRFAGRLLIDGFEPMGCDGSRIECPRSAELDARLRPAGKDDAAPTIWVTAFVHLATGLLWSWQVGPGTADERQHLRRLLVTLSPAALVVADAAYMGYELAGAIVQTKRSFLLRMSSRVHLYTQEHATLTTWSEGPVYYWPEYAQKDGQPPLLCRLIRVPAKGQTKRDVWLLTDILDPTRLSVAMATKFYRWRWRNEGTFRTYKRTLKKLKLTSRTVRLVHREAEVSLLAMQLLLAHADLALRPPQATPVASAISPRQVLLAIRGEMKGTAKRRARSYHQRLKGCGATTRCQTSAKARREWPRRKPHKPPAPPILHTLNEGQKVLLNQHFDAV
jgi:Transposase DDE domain